MADTGIPMRADQIDTFLAEVRHAIAGVIRSDGAPQLSPVWILYENGQIFFSVLADSAKARQLARDPRISLCVDAGHPDGRAVMIRGSAEIIREKSEWSEDLSWRINRRYLESDEATRRFLDENQWEGASVLVVVSPDTIIGRDFN